MPHAHRHPPEAGPLDHKPIGPWEEHEHRPREKKHLVIVLLLTGITMVVEVIGGLWTGSLALLSDAGHMFSHSLALLISYIAIVLASRPVGKHRSYGLYRLEVLAAFINGLTMFLVAGVIVYEAIRRLISPVEIESMEMMLIAIVGLIVNLVSALILARVGHGDLNVRSAFLHMLGDTASSVGVVLCAIVIYFTGWTSADPLVSLLIAGVICYWGVQLVRDSANILLESTPRHLDVDQVINTICKEVPEIHQLHDVHIWEITSHMYTMTAHALTDDLKVSDTHALLEKISRCAREHFNICHANIQFEFQSESDDS